MPARDDDDDAGPNRPPPHPLDRTWIHPSELAGARSQPAGDTRTSSRRGWRRDAILALTAGTVGAMATISVLGIVGAFDRQPARAGSRAPEVPNSISAAQIAQQIAPGVAAVITTAGAQERRGSGVAVGDHEVMTTAAVVDQDVEPGATVEVCVANGERHRATVTGRDPLTGLVLLSVPTLRFDPARMASSDRLRAGDWIVAVGRTQASGPWVTSGVVTATDGWTDDSTGTKHAGLINTNADLADSARGGALVDESGAVIGILAGAGSGPVRTAAVPSSVVIDVAEQLERQGWVDHGALGIRAQDSDRGVVVTEVEPGSGAASAGLRVNDTITAVDGVRMPDTAALVVTLRRRTAGQRVTVAVERAGRSRKIVAVLDRAQPVPDPGTGPFTPPATAQLVVAAP